MTGPKPTMTAQDIAALRKKNEDEAKAIRFLVIKVAVFMLVPAIAGGIAAWWVIG